jgi:hypothetical protein
MKKIITAFSLSALVMKPNVKGQIRAGPLTFATFYFTTMKIEVPKLDT